MLADEFANLPKTREMKSSVIPHENEMILQIAKNPAIRQVIVPVENADIAAYNLVKAHTHPKVDFWLSHEGRKIKPWSLRHMMTLEYHEKPLHKLMIWIEDCHIMTYAILSRRDPSDDSKRILLRCNIPSTDYVLQHADDRECSINQLKMEKQSGLSC
jgi:hypothetical protein